MLRILVVQKLDLEKKKNIFDSYTFYSLKIDFFQIMSFDISTFRNWTSTSVKKNLQNLFDAVALAHQVNKAFKT